MKVTILGCGPSGGVPLIGNVWGNCDPNEPKNRRTCCSILVEEGDQVLLVDTSPDMRQQLLNAGLKDLSAVFYTHIHADHSHGIDGLRSVNWLTQKPIPIYAPQDMLDELTDRFPYIFERRSQEPSFMRPMLDLHPLRGPLTLGSVRITPFDQVHGAIKSIGYRFNDFAYSTDVNMLDDAAFAALEGVKYWVVDCVRERHHPSHAHLELALEWIRRVKPEKAWLTHMNQTMDYSTLLSKLPAGVEPAYDGLVIPCAS